jgi:DnaK suppressor protein
MDKSELARFHQTLTTMRQEIIAAGDIKVDPNRKDESTTPDEDEQPLNEMEQVIASNRNRRRQGSLNQIDEALKRLADDPEYFGECLECEEPIAEGRLKLMPYAEYCVACQQKKDPARDGKRRHLRDFVS